MTKTRKSNFSTCQMCTDAWTVNFMGMYLALGFGPSTTLVPKLEKVWSQHMLHRQNVISHSGAWTGYKNAALKMFYCDNFFT